MEKSTDNIGWNAEWRIDKFHDPTGWVAREMQNGMPIEQALRLYGEAFIGTEKFDSNLALNEGLQELIDLICGLGTPTKWDSTNARLGVGDSNTAAAATQTGLQAETNKTYKAMDANYPQRSNQTAEWRATFGSSDLITHGKNSPLSTPLTTQEKTSTAKSQAKAPKHPAKRGR